MPKEYFCDKQLENGVICGERDVSKFIEGRYTSCRKCRNKIMSEYNKSRTEGRKEKEMDKIDPDKNIRLLIEEVVCKYPLIDGKYNISEKFKSTEEDISDIIIKTFVDFERINKKFDSMQLHIQSLEKEIVDLKSKLTN
jgi:hypothetical protein